MGTAGLCGTFENCRKTAVRLRQKAAVYPVALDGYMPSVPNSKVYGSPNDLYREGDPRQLTNSKNRSSIIWGDNRDGQFKTMNLLSFKPPPCRMSPMLHDLSNLTKPQIKAVYQDATKRVGEDGVRRVERAMMTKLQQRTAGGQGGLRMAFKYFDRDGSGTIDLDEFFKVIEFIGFSFNEDQVIALFGHYDVDCCGELDYYAFIHRVLNGNQPSMAPREEHAVFEVIPGKTRRYGAGPPLAYKVGQHVNQLVRWDVKRAFDKFDFDRDGSMDKKELGLLLVALGQHYTPLMLQQVMDEMDENKNGKIDFEEFYKWFSREATKGTEAILHGEKNQDNKPIGTSLPLIDANKSPLLLHDLKLSY